MKKLIIILLIAAAIPVSLYTVGGRYFSTARIIETHWRISIPSEYKEAYTAETPVSFHGDGERYAIFETEGGKILSSGNFSRTKDSSTELFVNTILNNLEVPKDKRPGFDTNYGWWKRYSEKDGSSLTVIYAPWENRMYFIEQIL